MKKLLITLLLIIFSSSFSLANDNIKITVEEIEYVFFGEFKKKDNETWEDFFKRKIEISASESEAKREKRKREKEEQRKQKKTYEKRIENRGIAKCIYRWLDYYAPGMVLGDKKCFAKVIRAVMSYSEKSKKRRPGDIFYALEAIKYIINDPRDLETERKFLKIFNFDEKKKPVACEWVGKSYYSTGYACRAFKKSTYKKIEKFRKDTSNEKVLGHKFIKYIKQVRMVHRIEEKLGTDNYALLGDFLNATVADVEKNNINPVLQKRRVLLKKYSLIMRSIENKLNEEKYKSIDEDVSKLLKTFETLKTLTPNNNETAINFDEAINIIFDTNKLVQSSALSAKNNEEKKLLALASIDFMQTLIDSILSTIPEKYLVYTKEINQDFFIESELAELENIIIAMTNKNKEIKSMELKKNMDIINKFINPSDTLKKLNSLGIINSSDRPLTRDATVDIINQEIRNNLDAEVLKGARKIFQEMDRNELADITKEASDIASEVASSSSVKEATSNRAVDREYGGQSLKKLIGAGIINR